MNKKLLIIELNEFSDELLHAALKQQKLPYLATCLSYQKTHYNTCDNYSSGYLEPWVQWVSIHTGTPSSNHQIKHLGDVPDLKFPQYWEILHHNDITTGVWGIMNGSRNHKSNVLFFLPDPWTFSEPGYPNELDDLLALPRYLAKNYLNLSKKMLLKQTGKLFKYIIKTRMMTRALLEAFRLLPKLLRFGPKHFLFITYFEYLSTLLFIQYKKKYNPQCNILFLNSLAHLQHHYWTSGTNTITPEIAHGLQYIDRMLQALFASRNTNETFIMHNGLSQTNTNSEAPWVLYRQKDPANFLVHINISAVRVEQLMTHDAHVFFASDTACERAYKILSEATINEQFLFHVEKNPKNPQKLFYRINFFDKLSDKNSTFIIDGKTFRFFDLFEAIVTRTGKHVPKGAIYSEKIAFPEQIANHEFNEYLYNYLNIAASQG